MAELKIPSGIKEWTSIGIPIGSGTIRADLAVVVLRNIGPGENGEFYEVVASVKPTTDGVIDKFTFFDRNVPFFTRNVSILLRGTKPGFNVDSVKFMREGAAAAYHSAAKRTYNVIMEFFPVAVASSYPHNQAIPGLRAKIDTMEDDQSIVKALQMTPDGGWNNVVIFTKFKDQPEDFSLCSMRYSIPGTLIILKDVHS